MQRNVIQVRSCSVQCSTTVQDAAAQSVREPVAPRTEGTTLFSLIGGAIAGGLVQHNVLTDTRFQFKNQLFFQLCVENRHFQNNCYYKIRVKVFCSLCKRLLKPRKYCYHFSRLYSASQCYTPEPCIASPFLARLGAGGLCVQNRMQSVVGPEVNRAAVTWTTRSSARLRHPHSAFGQVGKWWSTSDRWRRTTPESVGLSSSSEMPFIPLGGPPRRSRGEQSSFHQLLNCQEEATFYLGENKTAALHPSVHFLCTGTINVTLNEFQHLLH